MRELRLERAERWAGDLETFARVHLVAMRNHQRRAALLRRSGAQWEGIPDWRLDARVIGLGLHLHERLGVVAGDRAAILSGLRREAVLAELSVMVQGAVAVLIDPDLPVDALATTLANLSPKVMFVEGAAAAERAVLAGLSRHTPVIAFDEPRPRDDVVLLAEALELGSTRGSPEHAALLRLRARAVTPEMPALYAVGDATPGAAMVQRVTQGELAAWIGSVWSREPARPGDVAYVAAGGMTLASNLMVLAFLGDGLTTTALGTPGSEVEEIGSLHPDQVVAREDVLSALSAPAAERGSTPAVRGLWAPSDVAHGAAAPGSAVMGADHR